MIANLLLRGGLVLDDACAAFRAADVLLEGDRISAVGPDLRPVDDTEVWDLRGDLIVPGFVNAHYHSPDNLATGRMPVAPLELWSLASVPSRSGSPEDLRAAALLGAAQLLRGGVTAVVDMVRPAPGLTLDALDAVAGAYAEAGLRAAVVPVLADLPIENTLPLPTFPASSESQQTLGIDEQLSVVEAFFERWHGRDGRIQVHVGPSGPQRCSDELFTRAVELARRLGTYLHTHVLETGAQAVQAQRRWGRSMLAHLDHAGALGPSTVLAHLVWPEASDLPLLADRGAVVVHNPASNCALGSGRANLPALLAANVNVGLGTDAATCNDGLSMFEAMKLATILHRPFEPDWRRWPTPDTTLRMATQGGAAALGLADQLGRVAPGSLADLIVLDAGAPALVPPNNPAHQVVMRGGPDCVRHVLVGGRPLVRDRELVTLDWPAIADAARTIAATRKAVAPPSTLLQDEVVRMLAGVRGIGQTEVSVS